MRKVEWRTCKSGGEGATGGRPDQPVTGSTTRNGESNAAIATTGKSIWKSGDF